MYLFLEYCKHIMKKMKNEKKNTTIYAAFFSVNKVVCRLNIQIKTHILDKNPTELKLLAELIIPWLLNKFYLRFMWSFLNKRTYLYESFFSVLSRKQIKKRISKVKDWKQGVFFLNYVCDKFFCYIAKMCVLF